MGHLIAEFGGAMGARVPMRAAVLRWGQQRMSCGCYIGRSRCPRDACLAMATLMPTCAL